MGGGIYIYYIKTFRLTRIFLYLFILIFVAIWILPLIQLFLMSFKSLPEVRSGPWTIPNNWSFENYISAWKDIGIATCFKNSVFITTIAVFGQVLLSALSAFGLSRFKFKGKKWILPTILGCMVIPAQIVLVPLYKLLDSFSLLNSYWGLICVHIASGIPFCTFVLFSFMSDIPIELEEAAQIDGGTKLQIFYKIILPLSLPALVSVIIFRVTWVWNDFLFGLIFIQSMSRKPITVGIANIQGQYMTWTNLQSAAGILGSIIPVMIFLLLQRYFIKGLTAGAIKG